MVTYAGFPKELASLQGSLCASIHALIDPQKINSRCQWIWCLSKSCSWNRRPGGNCGFTARTCKWDNVIQGVNFKPHKHQPDTLPYPYPDTRGNFGALQEAADTTGLDELQETRNLETGNLQEIIYQQVKELLLESWKDLKSWSYQPNMQLEKVNKESGVNLV